MEETTPLFKLAFFKLCRKAFASPKLEMVSKTALKDQGISILELINKNEKQLVIQEECNQQRQIDSLIGDYLSKLIASKPERSNEVNVFRSNMARFRLENWNMIEDRLPEYLESEPLPKSISPSMTIICNLPGDKQKTITVDVYNQSVKELKEVIFDKYKKIDILKTSQKSANDYLLKVTGFRSYFTSNDKKLIAYDYIRSCINKNQQILLSLLDMSVSFKKEGVPLMDKVLAAEYESDLESCDSNSGSSSNSIHFLSSREVNSLFRVRVCSVKNILLPFAVEDDCSLVCHMLVELYFGGQRIDESLCTRPVSYRHSIIPAKQEMNEVVWNQWLAFTLPLSSIPKSTRVCFTFFVKRESVDTDAKAIAWVNYLFIDHRSFFSTGVKFLRLWPGGHANPIGTCVDNLASINPSILKLEFEKEKSSRMVKFEEVLPASPPSIKSARISRFAAINHFETAFKDSLCPFNAGEKKMFWEFREDLIAFPGILSKFLLSVDWTKSEQVAEVYRLLPLWSKPSPVQALQLLDANFPDPKVREYAIRCIDELNDGDLNDYLLQLTQVLKYETNHDSALARFLLKRSWKSKNLIGHYFFWHLKAELHVPEIAERFSLLLEAYLRGCGFMYRSELLKQIDLLNQLSAISLKIKQISKKDDRLMMLHHLLRQVEFPDRFQIPLFTNIELKGLLIEKCKVMSSKKLPLWLVFENADRNMEPLTVMFKCGDDLRQDVLTLQMIRIMDKLWTREGYQLRLSPYGVIATGNETGMVEIVLGAETTASINREAGGGHSVLVKDTLTKWFQKHNPGDQFNCAVENFALSCAGYCVATYVIGIGDRHNDNIMLKKTGQLFHIDFGHFLGHFKTKFGFDREKAPFVFTPQYAHILGNKSSPMYQLFEDTCCAAYNIVRKNADLFINLFSMMLSTGLEELTSVENIMFLRDQLALDQKDDYASAHFKQLIEQSLSTKTQQFMDIVHIWAN